ncbi:uncharacterized protein LOC126577608 [Anopheles aquasalis]|uniref:uncharacterized protein LOC126577608 n=1 Tax=Anopheles aquasalis TaxID=42839 RepID=UPI00215B0E35|nr:uncharacterized protein LOC126577608 [Anopheles aquasalis]
MMMAFQQVMILLLVTLTGANGKPLEIEHPHSFTSFKRGVMLGDVSYSYAATDIGSPANARYKTVTVIKNVSMPKPTSSMVFSDRAEHFYEALEQGLDDHLKKRTHQVEYWPPRDDNHLHQKKRKEEKKEEPKVQLAKQSQRGGGTTGTRNPYYRGRFQQDTLKLTTTTTSSTTTTTKPAAIREAPEEEEDAKHPIDLLELAKSAARTLNQMANGASGNGNTGPVTFPMDSNKTGKKKANGVVSLAKEYTSIVTAIPQQRQTIVSKLKTKVDPSPPPTSKMTFKQYPAAPSSTVSSSEEAEQPDEIPLVDFEQSEYVFNHKTGQFEFRAASKAPKEVQEYLRASGPGYGYRERPTANGKEDNTDGYSTPTELLFAELQNAVSSRNVTMIKSLASQLVETINIGKIDFQSLKTHPRGKSGKDDRRSTEQPMMVMMMMDTTTTGGRSSISDFGYGGETTTMEYQDDGAATTTEPMAMVAMTTIAPTTAGTKRPLRYIAPRLRGFKRFSSKKLSN